MGRQAELDQATAFLDRVRAGAPGCLVVVGDPGAGKSRLLTELSRLAAERGQTTARASCLPLTTPLPFEPVLELLRGVASPAKPPRGRNAGVELFTAAVKGFEQAADREPLVLMIDDLQFSDRATVDLVHYCVARLANMPVGWILATRPAPGPQMLAHHLVRDGLATQVDLQPFSASELGALLSSSLGGRPVADSLRDAILERAGGNAFLSLELVRSLNDQGLIVEGPDGLETGASTTVLPPTVVDAVAARLELLPDAARDLLAWLAVLPEPASGNWLAQVAPRLDADAELARLELAGFVARDRVGSWRFVHSLVRNAVYDGMPPGERASRHGVAADALAEEIGLVQRAPQLAAAGRADEAGEAYLALANEALVRGGALDATQLYERAGWLGAKARSPSLQRAARAGLVFALLRGARIEEAKRDADSLLRELRDARFENERLGFLSRFALALWDDASDIAAARAAIDEAAPLVARAEGRLRAEAAVAQASILDRGGEADRALPFAREALELARRLDDPARVAGSSTSRACSRPAANGWRGHRAAGGGRGGCARRRPARRGRRGLMVGLAARDLRLVAIDPGLHPVRHLLPRLGPGQPFTCSELQLAEPCVRLHRHAAQLAEHRGGVGRPLQVGAHDPRRTQGGKPGGRLAGLLVPDVVERHVGLALDAPGDVPLGSPVSPQDDAAAHPAEGRSTSGQSLQSRSRA